MPYVPLGPHWVGPGAVATNEEVGPDAVALSTYFNLHPDQQEAYEEFVAKGQIDVASAYTERKLGALSTKGRLHSGNLPNAHRLEIKNLTPRTPTRFNGVSGLYFPIFGI